jgi:nitrous oxidase accessory protein
MNIAAASHRAEGGEKPPVAGASAYRWILGAIALALVLAAAMLPLWRSALKAPQYPDGLEFIAYGTKVTGDLAEIDSLNHYVGMRAFRPDDLPEMALWPLGLALAAVAVAVTTVSRRRVLGRLARLYLWAFPFGILAVIQFRLYQFGHDLDPGAAFRMDGFTPMAVGPTTVWNFTAWSMPGSGVLSLIVAAAVVTFGPGLARRFGGHQKGAAVAAIAVAIGLALPLPAWASQPTDLETLLQTVPAGGTLTLAAGTYHGDVVIDRPITLEGFGLARIVGTGTGTVITVTAPGTVIRGVDVEGSGVGPAGTPSGIRIEANDVRVEGVTIRDSYVGIAVVGAERIRLVDNVIIGRGHAPLGGDAHAVDGGTDTARSGGRGDGISLWNVDGVLVRGNRIEDSRDGVYISFGSAALIDSNEIRTSRYGVHSMFATDLVLAENLIADNLSAAVLMYGGPALVLRNTVVDNRSPSTGFGLLLKDVADAEVVQNVIARNRAGIHLDGPAGAENPTRFTANTVAANAIGVTLYSSAAAVFSLNSFATNVVQVLQQGRGSTSEVAWSDRGSGNYWSTYQGYDNGRGKGLTPHQEGSSVERLLVRSPVLMPIASSPALRLVRAVEEKWALQRPVLTDHLPLIHPQSPPLPSAHTDSAAATLLGALGGAVSVAAGALLVTQRLRGKGST